jgi:hypothetical protein
VEGHHPSRFSVAQNAQLLLHHSRRKPALSCRADATSNEPLSRLGRQRGGLPISLHIPSALPVAQRHVAQGAQRVAEQAIRVVTDAAWQAEQAARLAKAAERGARRGSRVAASFGVLAVSFGIAAVAASHINTRTNAEMASVAAALRRLDATQRQISDRLTALRAPPATQAALVAPTSGGSLMPAAPAASPAGTVPVAPIGPALPVAIKPLPPVTRSVPLEPTRRQPPHEGPVQRARLNRISPSSVEMAGAAGGNAG